MAPLLEELGQFYYKRSLHVRLLIFTKPWRCELLDVNHWRDFVWLVMPAWLAAPVSTLGARDMAAMAATAAMQLG